MHISLLHVPTTIWTNWGHGGFPQQRLGGKTDSSVEECVKQR